MDKLKWILLGYTLIGTSIADLCKSPCLCEDKLATCNNIGSNIMINDIGFWNATNSEITMLKLEGNQLKHIQQFPKFPLEYLSLKNNSISTIDDEVFMLLPNLTSLDLSYNKLRSDELRPAIFKGTYSPKEYQPLRKLKTLFLGNNEIHTLHHDLFEHLPNLEFLSINNNPFKIIDKGTIISISSISKLKVLDLSNTQIKTLPEYMLHTPGLLAFLNLAENEFTTIPQELENSHKLETLILDDNPIKNIVNFPELKYLKVLHLNYLENLESIGPRSLSNLSNLEELSVSGNPKLITFSGESLSRQPKDDSEGMVWPIIKRLYLSYNKLEYLDHNLLSQWDLLEAIDLRGNPWVCDCKNQWMVSVLMPVIKRMSSHLNADVKCVKPVEMRGLLMEKLQEKHYQMRCLDSYGHQPEKDGILLIGIVIGLLLTIPLTLAGVLFYRRYYLNPRQSFARAFYKPADTSEYFIDS